MAECKRCGAAIYRTPKHKAKIFCSDECRRTYWNEHLDEVDRKAFYDFKCGHCGKDFRSYGNAHRIYCSRECSGKSRRKPAVACKSIERHNGGARKTAERIDLGEAVEQALLLHGTGYGYKKIANEVEVSLNTVKSWTRRYGELRVGGCKPQKVGERTDLGEAREKALSLHGAGYGYKTIAKEVRVSLNTVKSWIRRYGEPRGCNLKSTGRVSFQEWLARLREEAGSLGGDERTAHLFSGSTGGGKGVDALCAVIMAKYGMDPFDGSVYAFCGRNFDILVFLSWDGAAFNVVKRRKEYGRYIWPSAQLGAVIDVSMKEFIALLNM